MSSIWTDHVSPKSHRLPNKNSNMRNHIFSHWSVLSKRLLKYYRLLLTCLVAPERCKIRPYCWRHQALSTQGPEVNELDLIWRFSPWRLAFVVWKSTQASKGGNQPVLLLSYKPCTLQWWPAWHGNPKGSFTSGTRTSGNHTSLTELPTHSGRGNNAWSWKLSQIPGWVNSQVLKENLQPPLYWTRIISNYILTICPSTHR